MTTYVLMIWIHAGSVVTGPSRVDEYGTAEACEVAGRAWESAFAARLDALWPVEPGQWVCLPGEQ